MNISARFVDRPVATLLLTAAILVAGIAAYFNLPVAILPAVDAPTISVSASLPGANPQTMASNVAMPLERQFGQIAGVTQLTSASTNGSTSVTIQFDPSRDIDAAAQDVQAAITSAGGQLPSDLPAPPTLRKVNPSDAPIAVIALTSDTLPLRVVGDFADSVLSQRLAQIAGVGQVAVGGQQKPAVRVQIDPRRVSALGLGYDDVRNALVDLTTNAPKGAIDGPDRNLGIDASDQLTSASQWDNAVVAYTGDAAVRVRDFGHAIDDVENSKVAAWVFAGAANQDHSLRAGRAVTLILYKQANANVIATVDAVRAALPQISATMPRGIRMSFVTDRTQTIRASVNDIERTIIITAGLVVGVIAAFLQSARATAIPSVAIPVSLLGTAAAMALVGFSLDNLSLMAAAIAIGFVVDDAIVVTEAIWRRVEQGAPPRRAAVQGTEEVGMTVMTISLSLVAVFAPITFMGGLVGRFMQEFALTLSIAVLVSIGVSLTVGPTLAARLLRPPSPPSNPATRALTSAFAAIDRGYAKALGAALAHRDLVLALFAVTSVAAVVLYVAMPKGFFPQQDTGLLVGTIVGPPDTSFERMNDKSRLVGQAIARDPDVASVAVNVGSSVLNQASLTINLKPQAAGRTASAAMIIERLRPRLGEVIGVQTILQPAQDINTGGRAARAQYQYTLSAPTLEQIEEWTPRLLAAMKRIPGLQDVTSDLQLAGAAAYVNINRDAAARFGITPVMIDSALADLYGQRQITQYFTQINSYHVVLEALPSLQSPSTLLDLVRIRSPLNGALVPLRSFASIDLGARQALQVSHQGQFPAATISFNLAPGVALGDATAEIDRATTAVGLPPAIQPSFQGNASAFATSLASEPVLVAAALLAVYIILGVLYESLVHPLTILSTLPSAGLGALLVLRLTNHPLDVIGIIAILLLIGIVKKNGIMVVDVALVEMRTRGLAPIAAATEAAKRRLRPILMTTACALFGAIPLALANGPGSEFRQPLGLAIIGGLFISQALTLFSTPVLFVALEHLRSRQWRSAQP